jgi:hypothetical protein
MMLGYNKPYPNIKANGAKLGQAKYWIMGPNYNVLEKWERLTDVMTAVHASGWCIVPPPSWWRLEDEDELTVFVFVVDYGDIPS